MTVPPKWAIVVHRNVRAAKSRTARFARKVSACRSGS
jgi:hypothetical protein